MKCLGGAVGGKWMALMMVACAGIIHAADLTVQQQRDLVADALQTYDRGIAAHRSSPASARAEFLAAAQKLQLVIDSGAWNAPLLFNLGNAHYQAGDIGRAVLNYRRALALAPGDPRIRSNLESARSQCKTPIAPSGRQALLSALLWWHHQVPMRTRFGFFLVAHVILWSVLLLNAIRPWGPWRGLAIVAAMAWIPLGASTGAEFMGWGRETAGVLLTDNVIVRKGNGTGFEPQFAQPLSAGVEFEVIERRGEWLNIALPNGAEGWIESAQAELVS